MLISKLPDIYHTVLVWLLTKIKGFRVVLDVKHSVSRAPLKLLRHARYQKKLPRGKWRQLDDREIRMLKRL